MDKSMDIDEGLENRRSRVRPQVVQGHQRFRPRGRQFKKKSGSRSSGSDSSSSGSSSRVEFCGQCGGRHPTVQCVRVQGSCNVCGQYGHLRECVLWLDLSIPPPHRIVEVDRLEVVLFLLRSRASTLRIFPDSESYRDNLATVHRTLSSPIVGGRQLRLKCEICVARDFFVVIVAQET
ncbi:hypothetical protein F511_27465 [Dorcoceras hygrometricum]|uniref:Uncharacterized protein n=1 Tax=Dorcoceras hygrometricum TaxID=472368 RepID=A0A2Z7BUQ2_9LAMI|nr:hypothetical protein F511_27465 [Dorcoceras hygrometricum]